MGTDGIDSGIERIRFRGFYCNAFLFHKIEHVISSVISVFINYKGQIPYCCDR